MKFDDSNLIEKIVITRKLMLYLVVILKNET